MGTENRITFPHNHAVNFNSIWHIIFTYTRGSPTYFTFCAPLETWEVLDACYFPRCCCRQYVRLSGVDAAFVWSFKMLTKQTVWYKLYVLPSGGRDAHELGSPCPLRLALSMFYLPCMRPIFRQQENWSNSNRTLTTLAPAQRLASIRRINNTRKYSKHGFKSCLQNICNKRLNFKYS